MIPLLYILIVTAVVCILGYFYGNSKVGSVDRNLFEWDRKRQKNLNKK